MKRKVVIFIVIIVCVVFCVGLYEPIFKEIIPVRRNSFASYEAFEAEAEYNQYPASLPETTTDIRYYFYEGMLSDKSAYYAAYNYEDYEFMKKSRMDVYESENDRGGYCYEGGAKIFLSSEQVEQQKIEFICNVLPEDTYENYYFLAYRVYEGAEEFFSYGVLCNDETYEMIEFTCRICASF